MITQGDERELARVLRTVDLAFGRGAHSDVLELEGGQRADATAGNVPVAIGALLGIVALVGLGFAAWHRTHTHTRPIQQAVAAAEPFTAAKAKATPGSRLPPRLRELAERRRVAAVRRAPRPTMSLPPAIEKQEAQERKTPRDGYDGYIAHPLTGEALREALVEDSIRTRELNRAEMERLRTRT